MKRISWEARLSYTFDWTKPPVVRVGQEEEFMVETRDNTGGERSSPKRISLRRMRSRRRAP